MQALLITSDDCPLPGGTSEMVRSIGWQVRTAGDYGAALRAASESDVDVIVMPSPGAQNGTPDYQKLLRLIDVQRIAAFVIGESAAGAIGESRSLVDCLAPDVCLAELRGRFAMIERYQDRFRRLERELHNMERLGKRLNQHFREVDQEMRLAARLQQDFLPRLKEPVGNLRFSTLYRPANWVSGDIYDVFRVDEKHTAFYIADAVGHGVAASLLTMFIKRAVTPKRVEGDRYTILTPSETIAILNDALAEQELPNCQFVTACYCIFNHETRKLRCARAGHPYPILVTADGVFTEVKSTGGLLGLFKGAEFSTIEIELQVGDRLLLYSDGMELAFQEDSEELDTVAYLNVFRSMSEKRIDDMVRGIEHSLDEETGSLSPRDDVTIVGVEVIDAS